MTSRSALSSAVFAQPPVRRRRVEWSAAAADLISLSTGIQSLTTIISDYEPIHGEETARHQNKITSKWKLLQWNLQNWRTRSETAKKKYYYSKSVRSLETTEQKIVWEEMLSQCLVAFDTFSVWLRGSERNFDSDANTFSADAGDDGAGVARTDRTIISTILSAEDAALPRYSGRFVTLSVAGSHKMFAYLHATCIRNGTINFPRAEVLRVQSRGYLPTR